MFPGACTALQVWLPGPSNSMWSRVSRGVSRMQSNIAQGGKDRFSGAWGGGGVIYSGGAGLLDF